MANEIILQRLNPTAFTPTTSTLGWWKLDGNANDSSGNNMNGLANNVTWINNQCGSFNGTGSYILITHNAIFNTTTGLTIMGWYMPNTSTSTHTILDKGRDGYGAWVLYTGSPSAGYAIRFRCQTSSGNMVIQDGLYSGVTGQWNHAAATYDGNYGKIYLNGNLLATSSLYTGSTLNNTGNLRIGEMNDSAIPTTGKIDEVIIENRAWTGTEILNYYNYQNPRKNIFLTGSTYIDLMQKYDSNANTKLYYNFNNSTATNYDGVTGTTSGVTYGNGIYSKYIQFTGSTASLVNFNFNIDVTGTSTTMLTWIYVDKNTAGTDRQPIISSSNFCDNTIVFESDLNQIRWFSCDTWGSKGMWSYSQTFSINTGWMFVAVTRNTSTDSCSFYYTVNGTYTKNTNVAFEGIITWTPLKKNSPFRVIGKPNNTWQFKGRMDEIIVENRLWTDDEIYNYFQQSRSRVLGTQ